MSFISNAMFAFLITLLIVIAENKPLQGQTLMQVKKDQPRVLKAVAPTFIPFIFNETGVAEFLVEVKINNDGNVTSAKTISFSLFKDLSLENTAKKWVFEEASTKKERIAHIKFVMRIMPEETDLSELSTIYRFPAEIEVRNVVFKSQITTSPIPEMPKQKKPSAS